MQTPDASEAPTIRAPEPPGPPSAEATTFQHYLVERRADGSLWELGRGGMGVTYKATDANLHTPVALKIIGPQCFGGETSRRRFIREARLAAQIRHPNVAAIYYLDTQGEDVFYSMEYVDGMTADAWVRERGPMPVELALDVAMQVARALTAADRLHLVHRDIKPGNIMLLADPADHARVIAKVIDFGIAQSLAADHLATLTTGGFVGTPQYASPEQVEDLELDIRADIYSLGCTLWHLLLGTPPFVGSVARIISQQLTSEPPWDRLSPFPDPVKTLLRRMLAKDPAERPQNPVELHAEIRACREVARRPAPRPGLQRLWPEISGRLAMDHPRRRLVASAATAGLLIFGTAWLFLPEREAARASLGTPASDTPMEGDTGGTPPAPSAVPSAPASAGEAPRVAEAIPPGAMEASALPAIAPPAAPGALSRSEEPEEGTAPPPELIAAIPGLPALTTQPPADSQDLSPEPAVVAWNKPASLQLPAIEAVPAGLALASTAPESAGAIDLRSASPVVFALDPSAASRSSADRSAKSPKKPVASTAKRKRSTGSDERRPGSFRPVENIRRGVQGVLNKIF